jgi:hypothetical protein
MSLLSICLLILLSFSDATRTPTLTTTNTPSRSSTRTTTLTKTYQPITFVTPNTLVKGILQRVQIVCASNCTKADSVYLTSGSCGAPGAVPLGDSANTNSTILNEVSTKNFTATFDTTNLAPGVYVVCWKINATTVWINTGVPVTIAEFSMVAPSVISKSRDRILTITANPSIGGIDQSQIFLSSIGCPIYRGFNFGAREETSPIADASSSQYSVAAQGLRETSRTDDVYAVCYRMSPVHGWTDTLLRVRVVPTNITLLRTPSVSRGLNQVLQFDCADCASNNFVYLSSVPCSQSNTDVRTTSSFVVSTGTPSQASLDTSNVALGTYNLCYKTSNSLATGVDTSFSVVVRPTPVFQVTPTTIAKQNGQPVTLSCSQGCVQNDLIFLAQGSCELIMTAGPAGTDPLYIDNAKKAIVNAEILNPDVYKICFKALSATSYSDTGLTITVTGSRLISITPVSITRAPSQVLSLTCCPTCTGCTQGDFAYLTTLACSTDSTDPLTATSTTTLRQALTSSSQVSFDTSTLNTGTYRLCYRNKDGIYADAFIPISIRETTVSALSPTNLPKSSSNWISFICNGGCLDDSTVYLTTSVCTTSVVPGSFVSPAFNLTSNQGILDTSGLTSGFTYNVCFKDRGLTSYVATGITIFVRATPVISFSPRVIPTSNSQRLALTCINGCADGDFIYITSDQCGTTSTDPVPSSTTTSRSTLSKSVVFLDAGNLQPLSGYKICYRPLLGVWSDTNLTVIARSGPIVSVTPGTVAIDSNQRQQLTFECGNCSGLSIFLTTQLCDSPNASDPMGPRVLTNNVAIFDASNLKSGYQTICYGTTGNYVNSSLWAWVTSTAVFAVNPPAITKSINQPLVLSCNTGCSDGDYIYLSRDSCMDSSSDPSGTATTTTKFKLVSKTASVDASGLLPSQAYRICYLRSKWIDTGVWVYVQPTSLTVVTPSLVVRASNQAVTFSCTKDCSNADRVQLTTQSCSGTVTALASGASTSASQNLISRVAVFDASGLTPALYKVCYSVAGSAFVDSSLFVTVRPTNVLAITPSVLLKSPNQLLDLNCPTCVATDSVYLSSVGCSSTAPVSSPTTTGPQTLNTKSLNINATMLNGTYSVCYKSGTTFIDTLLTVLVIDNRPPPPPPSPSPSPSPSPPPAPNCTSPINAVSQCVSSIASIGTNVTNITDGTYETEDKSAVVVVVTNTSLTRYSFLDISSNSVAILKFGAPKIRVISRKTNSLSCSVTGAALLNDSTFSPSFYVGDALTVDRVSPTGSFVFSWTFPAGLIRAGETILFLRWSSCGIPERINGSNITVSGNVVTVESGRTSDLVPVRGTSSSVTLSPSVTTAGTTAFDVVGASNDDSVGLIPVGSPCTEVTQPITSGKVTFVLTPGSYSVCVKGQRTPDIVKTAQTVVVNAAPVVLSPVVPSPSPASGSSSGLDGGAIAGIVVGSVVGGLLILGLLGFALYKVATGGKADADVEDVVIEEKYPQEQVYQYSPYTPSPTPLQYAPY